MDRHWLASQRTIVGILAVIILALGITIGALVFTIIFWLGGQC